MCRNRLSILVRGMAWVGMLVAGGCQIAPSISTMKLTQHRLLLDFSGLGRVCLVRSVDASIAPPATWDELRTQRTLLYTHQQWRSPSHATGVGIVYINPPIPVSANLLVWLARNEYAKKSGANGRVISQWTDSLGRCWFEAENDKYRVRGYAMTHGFDAWIAYCGYRVGSTPAPGELGLAARSLETIVPGNDAR